MIRSAHQHRVNVLAFLVQHLAEVAIARRLVVDLVGGPRTLIVRIRQRNNVLRAASRYVNGRPAARADTGDIQFLVWRFVTQPRQRWRAAEAAGRNRAGGQSAKEKMSSRNSIWHIIF